MVNLNITLDVEPDAEVADDRTIVDVAVVERPYQHEDVPPVSAEPVLHVFEPLSRNFCARSDVVLADTV